MKPYFTLLPIPLLLLASCGGEPPRRAAQSQAAAVAVQVEVVEVVVHPDRVKRDVVSDLSPDHPVRHGQPVPRFIAGAPAIRVAR